MPVRELRSRDPCNDLEENLEENPEQNTAKSIEENSKRNLEGRRNLNGNIEDAFNSRQEEILNNIYRKST